MNLQEVEALLSENEMLQGKLHSQEEDFRLQNSTLMAELSKVKPPPSCSAHLHCTMRSGALRPPHPFALWSPAVLAD